MADTETVMREIAARVPKGVSRIPDGETGDRQQWIFFQLGKFQQTPGLEPDVPIDMTDEYSQMPKVKLSPGTDPERIEWPNLGYADVYQDSFAIFDKLQEEGTIPAGVRFQVEYPTPLASISGWLIEEDQDKLEPSYERALLADLDRLLDSVPHDRIAVQWDVAVEFGILELAFPGGKGMDDVVERLARYVDHVPADVPVGLHLCYGDYHHQHFQEPESLAMQVEVLNRTTAAATRRIDFVAFTVPQYQREPSYFEPLASLEASPDTGLFFALVPYHPDTQPEGTTAEQVSLIDGHLGDRPWGICTECGMARAERDEIPTLLDLHREIIAPYV
ncbi:MAG: hypothetical protein ACRD0A_21200 [Acidimicrobiales bacterium]